MEKALFSTGSTDWETPQDFFENLDQVFDFDIDVCATAANTKCEKYFSREDNGLLKEWTGTVWCNPPYGRDVEKWVKKGHDSHLKGTTVVMLLPARTDTNWMHKWVFGSAIVIFLKGRLKFGKSLNSAPFPSMLAIWGGSSVIAAEMSSRLNGYIEGYSIINQTVRRMGE